MVGKLPFEPVGLLTPLTHRNLKTPDMTDCSAFFVYALSSMSLRPLMQRYLNLSIKVPGQDMSSLFAPSSSQLSSGSPW